MKVWAGALIACLVVTGCGGTQSSTPAPFPPLPSFFVGWYSSEKASTDGLAAYRRLGVNLMLPYRSGEPFTSRWLREARAQGIRLLLQPDWRWIARGNLTALQTFVRQYRGSPALYGWYLYDEPETNGLAPDKLTAAYHAIKQIDSHPVAVVFTAGGCRFGAGAIDPAYLAGFDLLMYDIYPFYSHPSGIDPLAEVRQAETNCVDSVRQNHKLGPIMVLQAFGNGQKDGSFSWRDPTYAETACTFAGALRAGVLGVLFWSDQKADAAVQRNTDNVIAAWNRGQPDSCALAKKG